MTSHDPRNPPDAQFGRGSIEYPGNLSGLLDRAADLFPDRDGIGFGDEVLSFHDYHERACRLAHGLRHFRVDPSDRVLLVSHNSLEFALVAHAVFRVGGVLVPVNPAIRPHELAHIVSETRPRMAFVEARGLTRFYKTYRLLRGELMPTLVTIEGNVPLTMGMEDVDREGVHRTCEPMAEDDLAMIVYTAAMDGYALGAELTHGALFHNAVCCADASFDMSDTSGEVALCMLPLYHCHGFTSGFFAPLAGGVVTYPMDAFREVNEIVAAMETHRVTQMVSVPAAYQGLFQPLKEKPDVCARITNFTTGGIKTPIDLMCDYRDTLGTNLFEGYGLTEACPVVTWNPCDREPRVGTVGIPLPCCEVKIADDSGAEVQAAQEGEILIRGLNLFRGYLGQPEKTARVLDSDGWFKTGDLGMLDEDGCLTWTGLKKDMINVFGLKVYPREVERLLRHHPDVERVEVHGVEHDRYGTVVTCDVWPKAGKTMTDRAFRKYCRHTVSPYKIPRQITVH